MTISDGCVDRESGRRHRVAVTASPVEVATGGNHPPAYFFISFNDLGEVPPLGVNLSTAEGWEAEKRLLRRELQGTIEELQASNEELKASIRGCVTRASRASSVWSRTRPSSSICWNLIASAIRREMWGTRATETRPFAFGFSVRRFRPLYSRLMCNLVVTAIMPHPAYRSRI